jgi:uncharacterized membrane protein YozB (DUF420 family)
MNLLFAQLPGFLGTRASLMLDVVFVAMFLVVPLMAIGIALAKRGQYVLHKRLQLATAAVLLLAVLAFEIDMRFFTDWRLLAAPSPYFSANGWNPVTISLTIHLFFAVPTLLLWIVVVARALKYFPCPPRPGAHSEAHKLMGWLATVGMVMTAVTGWGFYWLAFVAV